VLNEEKGGVMMQSAERREESLLMTEKRQILHGVQNDRLLAFR
jgi:hypothetical protein